VLNVQKEYQNYLIEENKNHYCYNYLLFIAGNRNMLEGFSTFYEIQSLLFFY